MDNNFKLKFNGQQHQIDANTLISSLVHTTSIIQEINRNLDSGKKIEIKINALEKGSFMINIELIETLFDQAKTLFTKDSIDLIANIVAIFGGVLSLHQFLEGRKIKETTNSEDNFIEIVNSNGDIKIFNNCVFNIYQNSPVIKEAITQNFEALQNDSSIDGFELIDNDQPIIKIDRSDFDTMSQLSEDILNDEKIIVEAAILHITRLSFESNLKWDFYFRGNKIAARIKDPNFYTLIDKGEAFAKGDVLEVELETVQKFDPTVNTFVNKSYQINKIIRHIGRTEQQALNFTD